MLKRLVEGPVTWLAIAFGHLVVLGLGKTWRVRFVDAPIVDAAREQGRGILFSFSHGVLLPMAFSHRNRPAAVLISRSRDGEIIARISARLGYRPVRGSTSKGGGRAAVEMVELAHEGRDLGITPDGPRGPRGSVERGVARLAARARLPVVAVGISADRAWRARSWDRFLVPKPGASVWIVYGPPLRCGPEDDPAGDDQLRVQVGSEMERVERRAEAYAAGHKMPPSFRAEPA